MICFNISQLSSYVSLMAQNSRIFCISQFSVFELSIDFGFAFLACLMKLVFCL